MPSRKNCSRSVSRPFRFLLAETFVVTEEMYSQFSVSTALELETGEVAVPGSVKGPLLMSGWTGSARTSAGIVEVLVVGVGVSDRTIGPPDRQGILVKMLRGEPAYLNGATLEFKSDQDGT